MRRLALILCLVAAAPAAVIATSASAGDTLTYKVELDNAFGLVKDSDVKVAGVIAGGVKNLGINEAKRAVATIELKREMTRPFRTDARCVTRPQSLIAEYFIDCQPGKASQTLPDNGLIPVSQTGSTVQPDLVNNILRQPYRDRLRLVIDEFGTALAGRPHDLNRAIHNGVPALRDTRKVLEVLATQNKTIRDLNVNSDKIIGALAKNKANVSKFVTESRQTAEASASRKEDISASFHKLPAFLSELQPTLANLGKVADEQTPIFRDLHTSATQLERLTHTLSDFTIASVPNIKTLGAASKIGRQAVIHGRDSIAQLARLAENGNLFSVSNNLAKLTTDLDDPNRAVEPDSRAPNPDKGYTGFQGLLNYAYYQAGSINNFDKFGHALRLAVFSIYGSGCENYSTKFADMNNDGKPDACVSWLGPNQPGLTQDVCIKKNADGQTIQNFCPVPPFTAAQQGLTSATARSKPADVVKKVTKPITDALPGQGQSGPSQSQQSPSLIPDLPGVLDDILGIGKQKPPTLPNLGGLGGSLGASNRATTNDLLDFIFGS